MQQLRPQLPPRAVFAVQVLAAQHLEGRILLPGNPVVLPVMGRDILFKVCMPRQSQISHNPQASSCCRHSSTLHIACKPGAPVQGLTRHFAMMSVAWQHAQGSKLLDAPIRAQDQAAPESARHSICVDQAGLEKCFPLSMLMWKWIPDQSRPNEHVLARK